MARKRNRGSDIQASGSGLSQKKKSAFMDDENKDVLQGGKSEKPVEKPENSGKMKKMKKVKKVKKVRKTKKTLKNIQATEMNDWDSIVSIEDLKNANVRAVTSKLHSVKSNRGDIKLIHVVTGREVIARIQGPEKMSLTQLGHYLCLGNSTKINQNRQKLRKLMDLVPKSKTTIPAVTSGWSLLTEGDVEYQIQSMMQLTEFLVDKVKIKDEVLESLAGTPAQKAGHIEKTKEIIGQLIKSMNRTELNNAMHGKVFEAFGTILETMLPDGTFSS
ncbi:uncharacterized protein [Mytilus edulis]|uniref:uncharacterized protein n=1 Tax=Mytilus edulis TaxID=6550 RepID=UPI0039F05773